MKKTADQDLTGQNTQLNQTGAIRVSKDVVSGKPCDRRELCLATVFGSVGSPLIGPVFFRGLQAGYFLQASERCRILRETSECTIRAKALV